MQDSQYAPQKPSELDQEIRELQRISLLPQGQKEWQLLSQPYFMVFLVKLLNQQQIKEQTKIFVASLIAKIYNDKIEKCSYEETVLHIFDLIFSWKIGGKIKHIIKRAVKNVFNHFKQSYIFFEGIYFQLLEFMDNYKIEEITEPITFTQSFRPSYSQNSYTFNISFPQNYIDLQYVIIILTQCLFHESPEDKSQEEQKNFILVSKIRLIHKNIFKKISITQNILLFSYLLDLWQIIFNNLQHNLLNQKKQLQKMTAWSQLPQHFQLIFNQNAKSGSMNVDSYNYLLFNQNWEDTRMRKLFILKEDALRMFSQFVSLMSVNCLENGIQYLQPIQTIKNSLNESIFFLAANHHSLSQQQLSLGRYILSLAGTLIQNQRQISLDTAKVLFIHVIIPLMNNFCKEEKKHYSHEDEFKQFYSHLNDCCSQQRSETLMSSLCRLVQICVDRCQPFYFYLRQFIKESLVKNSKITTLVQLQYFEWVSQGIYFCNQCCFLTTSLLSYYSSKKQEDCNWFKQLLVLNYVQNLSEYELIYLYVLLTYQYQIIFPQINQENEFFFMFPLETNSTVLQYAGMEFLINLKQRYYSHKFIITFLCSFMKIKSDSFKWTLLAKTVRKSLYNFSQQRLSELLSNFQIQMLNAAQCLSIKMDQKTGDIDTTQIYQYLGFCRQISRQHQYLKGKFLIIDQLVQIVSHIKLMNKFWIDDEVALIAGQVLQCLKLFPSNFIQILIDIIDVYKTSEYQGNGYYHIFNQSIDILSKQMDEQMLMMIYSALQQGISYLAYYPEKMNFGIILSLNSHIILMQKFYLIHGQYLNKLQITDVKGICNKILDIFNEKNSVSRILSARSINLKLICDTLLKTPYNYNEIINYAKDKVYFNKIDSGMLLYLLQKIREQLPVEYCKQTFLMLLYFLKVGDENGIKNGNSKSFQDSKKLNFVMNYVSLPIDLEVNFRSQCGSFLSKFKQAEQETFIIARNYYLNYYENKKQPLDYLYELESQYDHRQSFLDGIKQMQNKFIELKAEIRLEDKKQLEEDDLEEGEIRLKKKARKIWRIKDVKMRGENDDGESDKSQPKAIIRNFQQLRQAPNQQMFKLINARKKLRRQSLDRDYTQKYKERSQYKSIKKNK